MFALPVYKCPKCGRKVELPIGRYYCKVCGPSSLMVLDERIPKTSVPTTIEEKLKVANCIIQTLRRKGFKAKLVGSVARREEAPYSDVDIIFDGTGEDFERLMMDKDIIECLKLNPDVVVDLIPVGFVKERAGEW